MGLDEEAGDPVAVQSGRCTLERCQMSEYVVYGLSYNVDWL